jgi:hypothetical protein
MFGFGRTSRRRVRSDTFAPTRLGGAALAGLGMLAWKWWRNRQAPDRPTTSPGNIDSGNTLSETTTPSAGVY